MILDPSRLAEIAACRPAWIAARYGDRDRQVLAQAGAHQEYVDQAIVVLGMSGARP
jgi:hypothetical protein